MSVSLALLPVALALRVVMGKDGFAEWVASQQVRVPSCFETELDLSRTVKKAGFDAVRFGSSIKTHLDREKAFIFWERVNEKWVAVFSKQHTALIPKFIADLEAAAGRSVFSGVRPEAGPIDASYSTNFTDADLLCRALLDLGADPVRRADGTIACRIEGTRLIFAQEPEHPFTVAIQGAADVEQAYRYLSDIDEDYKRAVQTSVYERVKTEAADRDMVITGEEVLPDRSIMLTLRLN
jgi:hypothetical protein